MAKATSLRAVVDVEYSKRWMQQFAIEMETDVASVLAHAEAWLNSREEWVPGGHEWLNIATPDDFWKHYKALTGKDGDGDFITCEC